MKLYRKLESSRFEITEDLILETDEGYILLSDYDNNEHVPKLLDRVYATISIFDSILDMEKFIDYSKKRNIKLLEEL